MKKYVAFDALIDQFDHIAAIEMPLMNGEHARPVTAVLVRNTAITSEMLRYRDHVRLIVELSESDRPAASPEESSAPSSVWASALFYVGVFPLGWALSDEWQLAQIIEENPPRIVAYSPISRETPV